jgi:hypothetical protein
MGLLHGNCGLLLKYRLITRDRRGSSNFGVWWCNGLSSQAEQHSSVARHTRRDLSSNDKSVIHRIAEILLLQPTKVPLAS